MNPDRPAWTPRELATLKTLWRLGWHQERIAGKLGRTVLAVRSMRLRLQLPKRLSCQRAKPYRQKA